MPDCKMCHKGSEKKHVNKTMDRKKTGTVFLAASRCDNHGNDDLLAFQLDPCVKFLPGVFDFHITDTVISFHKSLPFDSVLKGQPFKPPRYASLYAV